jgi:hypothetical protein
MGIPGQVIDMWHHKTNLGVLLLVPLPARNTTPCYFPHSSFRPVLTTSNCHSEMQSSSNSGVWHRFRFAWARKLLADGTAAPHIPVEGLAYRPIPPHLGGETPPCDPFGPYGKYPMVHYYPTAERAHQWMEWRSRQRALVGSEPRAPVSWQ